jgi:hypothetical protein
MQRRQFIAKTSAATLYLGLPGRKLMFPGNIEVVPLTSGPEYHWFGYYDKLQADPGVRYVLGMQNTIQHRSPSENDRIRIGMIDLNDSNRWIDIGESISWGWQQGCMLQWIPGSKDEIIWNDRESGSFVSHIYNIRTGKNRTLPKAVYALSPDGKWAIGTEFSRIDNLRPGYGYAGIPDPYEMVKAPGDIGIYKIDLRDGTYKLLFSLAGMADIPHQGQSVADNFHWFNHLLVNTDGSRFTFLHRWRQQRTDRQTMASRGFVTRMFTASANGDDLFIIDPSGWTSHFVWRDPSSICAWTQPEGHKAAFYLLEDKSGKFTPVGQDTMIVNGHNTYVPWTNNEWILNDTYPQGKERLQEIYLYHVPSGKKVSLGKYHLPEEYRGEWRCDLHPKCTPDGEKVIFDSTHGGNGRQMYMIDISGIF